MKNFIIDSLIAVGTLMVAAAAIWGDWFRSWLAPTKLIIEPHNNLRGDPTVFKPRDIKSSQPATRVMYFHLKVVNQRPWLSVKNCRVLLKGMKGVFKILCHGLGLRICLSASGSKSQLREWAFNLPRRRSWLLLERGYL
jgi:hypothetical protein